jgi:hypothetical protein
MADVQKQTPVSIQELLLFDARAIGRPSKAFDREGYNQPTGILAKDFRGTGDVSTNAQSNAAITAW